MVLQIYRLAHWLKNHKIPLLPFLLKSLNRIMFSVVLPPTAILGKNVLLSYEGLGTVIHRRAVIGDNVVIGSGVTIGGRGKSTEVPIIGEGSMIGSGAKVLGPIKIGKYVSVGANAVVLTDLPDYAVAVGIPAKIVKINKPEDIPDYYNFKI
ncbi:MAG: serine O-acetyltransferase [Pseudomonadota bacterium]